MTLASDDAAIMVELRLDPERFPRRHSFMPLVAEVAALGRMDCIELALAPNGGGHLGFLLYGAKSLARLRESLGGLVGEDSIVKCRAVPA